MTTGTPARRGLVALSLAVALLAVPVAAGHAAGLAAPAAPAAKAAPGAPAPAPALDPAAAAQPTVTSPSPSPTGSAERQKLAKTRFVLNAGLAAGAVYEWIVKPAKAGKFKKGAHGRRLTFVKAGLAGAFAYNRLKAASRNAKGDPTLSRFMAPVTAAIDSLKALPSKLRKGDDVDGSVNSYNDVINKVKDAGRHAGADVKEKVPSLSDLTSGSGGNG